MLHSLELLRCRHGVLYADRLAFFENSEDYERIVLRGSSQQSLVAKSELALVLLVAGHCLCR